MLPCAALMVNSRAEKYLELYFRTFTRPNRTYARTRFPGEVVQQCELPVYCTPFVFISSVLNLHLDFSISRVGLYTEGLRLADVRNGVHARTQKITYVGAIVQSNQLHREGRVVKVLDPLFQLLPSSRISLLEVNANPVNVGQCGGRLRRKQYWSPMWQFPVHSAITCASAKIMNHVRIVRMTAWINLTSRRLGLSLPQ